MPTWRSTVAADDDLDKRGVSDPPIRGGAMIATQEGVAHAPITSSMVSVSGGKERRTLPASDARYRVAAKGTCGDPEVARSIRGCLPREAVTEGDNTLPACCLPFWLPSSIRESNV